MSSSFLLYFGNAFANSHHCELLATAFGPGPLGLQWHSVYQGMLLKPGTGNRERPGAGNGEQKSGNERSAVFHIKIQNGGRENSPGEKRTTEIAKYTVNLT